MFEKANEIKALLEQKEKALQGCIRTILTRYVHGVLIVDESRTILFANPAAEGIFDSGEKGLQGRPFEYPIASGVTKELNVRSREGKTVAVEMWMVEIEWDGKPAFFISLHDITERKLAEEALAISEIRYRRLFETAKDGILILDADTGQITDINPFLVEMLGYTTEELLEKRLWEIGSFKDIAASRAAFSELQQKEYL
ncbi:MAG: PAS domain-containing protein, partial [Desulfobacteraceae bacterium]|nr:PAS domain-containing protein [Desulfobacteraceae bacterium]